MFASSKTNAVANGTANYIEDVFSTYLYTGNDSTQTITNGIDLSGKGGLVWIKKRNSSTYGGHLLVDTANGKNTSLSTNITNSSDSLTGFTSFNTNGFSMSGACYTYLYNANETSRTYASWTFRKQPKFFDVVTWTGNGASSRTLTHNLQAYPNCVIIKRTDSNSDWWVWHAYASNYLQLNSTAAANSTGVYSGGSPTDFTIWDTFGVSANVSGGTYVAYLFASDAGGFGLTGTDNVISCGSYTGNGSSNGPTITLGYEPQWLLIKRVSGGTGNWLLLDNMRGITKDTWCNSQYLYPNLSNAESQTDGINILPTGFQIFNSNSYINASSHEYIYIAIRRGPMKVPTSGTSVFSPATYTGNGGTTYTGSVLTDLFINKNRTAPSGDASNCFVDRLRGGTQVLFSNATSQEYSTWTDKFDLMTGVEVGSSSGNRSGNPYIGWNFRRAPSFFDEVCYTGTGGATTVTHNLNAVPELIIVKGRSQSGYNWVVYSASLSITQFLLFSATNAAGTYSLTWNNTPPTSTVFSLNNLGGTNDSGQTYVAYLFATCAGVSKVGSYTGTGTTKQIDCGFTGGARFVLIKRTDSTGDWYVWDTARGIVSGNDPYLLLNSTAAETTGTDYIDTYSAGFEISSTAPAEINASGGTFIFLAIA